MTGRILLTAIASLYMLGAVPGDGLRKDKAAVLLYGGMFAEPRLIARADTANLVEIILLNVRGDALSDAAVLRGRPCYAIAVFTRDEWASIDAEAKTRQDVSPGSAALRVLFYPAVGELPAVVHDPLGRARVFGARAEAWISLGAERVRGLTVPVRIAESGESRCTAASRLR